VKYRGGFYSGGFYSGGFYKCVIGMASLIDV
jgi:hypothetical protein